MSQSVKFYVSAALLLALVGCGGGGSGGTNDIPSSPSNTAPAAPNVPPTASSVCDNTPLNTAYNGNLSDSVVDPDSATLVFSLDTQATKGTAAVNPDGTFTYTPNDARARGLDSFTYLVDDLAGGTDTETVTLIIGDTRIMPLGDSLTSGTQSAGVPAVGSRIGYRKTLYDSLIGMGYAVDFVGSLTEGQDIGLADIDHEGHGGIETAELVNGLPTPSVYDGIFQALEDNPADIILLHIGTNDSPSSGGAGPNPGATEVQVENLLNEVDRWENTGMNGNPVTVIVARIINQVPNNRNVTTVNNAVVQLVQNRITASDDDLIIVNQESALDYANDMADALHPRPQGYDKMANVWLFPLTGTGTQTGTGTTNLTGAHTGPGILPICN